MLTRRVALEAVAFAIAISAFSCILHAAEPARRWRPATAADLPADTPIQAAMPASAGSAPNDSAAQRVHIDPATGAIVPAPADASAEAAANADIDAGAPPLVLQKSPSGILYVDTTGYRHTATVTLDAQGQPHLDCEEPPQDAASAARLAGHAVAQDDDHAGHAHAMPQAAPAPASNDADSATPQAASAATAKAEARQQRLAALVAAAGSTTAAAPTASTATASPPAPRRPDAVMPPTAQTPAPAASPSTAAEQ